MKNHHPVHTIPAARVAETIHSVIAKLPPFWQNFHTPQVARVSEEISWIYVPGGTVVDLGGGAGFHASICASLGMRAISVDNFKVRSFGHACDHFIQHDLEAEKIFSSLGVEYVHTDLLSWQPPFPEGSIDVVMSFDNIEHLHHSPRGLYQRMTRCLRPNGTFLLGGPNAVNVIKRFEVPLGKNIFEPLEHWYFHEHFIGHVREPILADLEFIARDLGLTIVNTMGRNWLGAKRVNQLPGFLRPAGVWVDHALRFFPQLCSDIYILARRK